MNGLPQIVKAERNLTGEIVITFKEEDKETETAFSDIRAGISWPIRSLPGYLCIMGLLSAAQVGQPKSLMLIYERTYEDNNKLMVDAYNRAHDLRFQRFYSDLKATEWHGFNREFQEKVRRGLGGGDIRLEHSYLAHDFRYGFEVVNRFGQSGCFIIPKSCLLSEQLRQMVPANLEVDRPENKFNAINGFRYAVVAFDKKRTPSGLGKEVEKERVISVQGWA